jgi:hypothetical protein
MRERATPNRSFSISTCSGFNFTFAGALLAARGFSLFVADPESGSCQERFRQREARKKNKTKQQVV